MTDKRFGGFWRRFWAFWVDQLILCFLNLLCHWILGMMLAFVWGLHSNRYSLDTLTSAAFTLFISVVYFIWFHGLFGRTPGKRLLGLKVIQVSGRPMTLGVAFLRWVGSLVSQLALCLGYLWVAFDPRKQGWHDKIAATLVIRTGDHRPSETFQLASPEPTPPAAMIPYPPAPTAAPETT